MIERIRQILASSRVMRGISRIGALFLCAKIGLVKGLSFIWRGIRATSRFVYVLFVDLLRWLLKHLISAVIYMIWGTVAALLVIALTTQWNFALRVDASYAWNAIGGAYALGGMENTGLALFLIAFCGFLACGRNIPAVKKVEKALLPGNDFVVDGISPHGDESRLSNGNPTFKYCAFAVIWIVVFFLIFLLAAVKTTISMGTEWNLSDEITLCLLSVQTGLLGNDGLALFLLLLCIFIVHASSWDVRPVTEWVEIFGRPVKRLFQFASEGAPHKKGGENG